MHNLCIIDLEGFEAKEKKKNTKQNGAPNPILTSVYMLTPYIYIYICIYIYI